MQKTISFLESAFLGSALVVLPAWLAVLLLVKALVHLEGIVKPVSKNFPRGVGMGNLLPALLDKVSRNNFGQATHSVAGLYSDAVLERAQVFERLGPFARSGLE